MPRSFLIPAALLTLALPALADIVVALKPDKNPDQMLKERRALESFLAAELKKPARVIVPLSAAVILEGLDNGTIDAAYLGSLDMVNARERKAADVLLGVEQKGKLSYESYWVSLKGKPYRSIADLKNRPVAFASRTSTSGYLVPHWALVKKGLVPEKGDPETFFGKGNVWYGTGYVSAIERVLDGTAEAAAVSDYVILENKHLTAEQKERLQVIDRQGPVPTHVIAVRRSLAAREKSGLKRALEALNWPERRELRDQLFTAELVDVDAASHLGTLEEALRLTGTRIGKP